jgi:hypothetical protein
MRRAVLFVSVLTALTALLPMTGPSSAQGLPSVLNITKVVEGPGPGNDNGFIITYSCTSDGGGAGGAVAFEEAAPGSPETQSFEVPPFSTCTVTEEGAFDQNNADSVSFACDYTAPIEGDVGCLADNEVGFSFGTDSAEITVTNTYDAEVVPEDPPAVDDVDVVAATPAFTG